MKWFIRGRQERQERATEEDIKEKTEGAVTVTGCQSVFDTPTLTLESLLAKTPAKE